MLHGEDVSPDGLKFKKGRLYFRIGNRQYWSVSRSGIYKGQPWKTVKRQTYASHRVADKRNGLLFDVSRTSIQAADAKTQMVRFTTPGLDQLFASDVDGIGRARLLDGGYVFYTGATAGPWSPAALAHKDRTGFILKLGKEVDMYGGGFAEIVGGNLIIIDRSGNLIIEYDLLRRKERRRAKLGFSTLGTEAIRAVRTGPDRVALVLAGQAAGQVVMVDLKTFSIVERFQPAYCR